MIRLLIDNEEAVVETDSSIEIIRKNPFFSKEGDLTYDINIDLKYHKNAMLYGFLNRFQILDRPTGRNAALYDGVRCLIRGTEIVLSIDEDVVRIQIVGTNSELNYLTGFEMSIRGFDYGDLANPGVQYPEDESPTAFLNDVYPAAYYNYAPVFIKNGDAYEQANLFRYNKSVEITPNEEVKYIRQPFFLFYVEKIIELIGYKLVKNELRNYELFTRLQIVTSRNMKNWQDVLPDWTVDEFISEVEKFCNCLFIVDQHNKEISIRLISTFYQNAEIEYINNVMDDRNLEFSENPDDLYINYSSVKYDLPSDEIYKYACLDDGLRDVCTTVYMSDFMDLQQIDLESHYDKLEIYNLSDRNVKMIIDKNEDGYYWREVDKLKGVGSTEDEVELKIYPAITWPYSNPVIYDNTSEWSSAISMAPIAIDLAQQAEKQGLNDAIKNGVESDEALTNIMVSCSLGIRPVYRGMDGTWVEDQGARVPFRSSYPTLAWYTQYMDITRYMPFSLELNGGYGMYTQFYSKNMNIDTQKKITIHFLTDKILDPKMIFQFRNKRYYCKQLKYNIEDGLLSKCVEGEFYPIE